MKKIAKLIVALFAIILTFSLAGCVAPYNYDNANAYTKGGAELSSDQTIKEIEIDWLEGSVEISQGYVNTVTFSETGSDLSDAYQLRYKVENNVLTIKFCKSGVDSAKAKSKALVVVLPGDLRLDEVSINTVSADVSTNTLKSNNIDIETVSGNVNATNCSATDVEIETVSGNVKVSGDVANIDVNSTSGVIDCNVSTLREIDVESVSGNVEITSIGSMPQRVDVETVSGEVRLNLPPADFSVKYETTSGVFYSEYPTTTNGNVYVYGDGGQTFEIETVSGNLKIFEI